MAKFSVTYIRERLKRLPELEREQRVIVRRLRDEWRILGGAMREHRESLDVTLRELARALGVSAPFLSDMERGNRRYTAEYAEQALSVIQKLGKTP